VHTPSLSIAANSITSQTMKTAGTPVSATAINDPRIAAGNFVEHVNYARVALAMKNADLATQHIAQARSMMTIIDGATVEQRRITDVGSGRIAYQYETTYKYHYFPIQTGLMQVKEISNGPVWAANDLAVTDADIVYLTLDLTDNKAEKYLQSAVTTIAANDLIEAYIQLAMLIDAVVTVDSKISVPSDKARDNIALARNFIAGKNYDGARYALKHGDDALDEMQRNDAYKAHYKDIISMRKDISELQTFITKKDPTMIEKADKKLGKWWGELKTWTKK
jgi:hypothetical protein